MKLGWISFFGACLVIVILVPQVIYALKYGEKQKKCDKKILPLMGRIFRYACMILMWLPLLVKEFGFGSNGAMLLYFFGNIALIIAYQVMWALYFQKKSPEKEMAVTVLPVCVYLLSGILLFHPLLIGAAVLFGIGSTGNMYFVQKAEKERQIARATEKIKKENEEKAQKLPADEEDDGESDAPAREETEPEEDNTEEESPAEDDENGEGDTENG